MLLEKSVIRDLGLVRISLMGISIVISLIIGFVFTGGILGIGLGTVISMIFTGRVIALLETSTSKLYSSVTEIEFVE